MLPAMARSPSTRACWRPADAADGAPRSAHADSAGPADPASTTTAAGIPFSALDLGRPGGPAAAPHPRRHGSRPGLVAGRAGAGRTGRRVVAVDLPGHGLTGHWQGHHRFRDNAADLAALLRAAGLDRARAPGRRPQLGRDDRGGASRGGLRPGDARPPRPAGDPATRSSSQMVSDPAERRSATSRGESRPARAAEPRLVAPATSSPRPRPHPGSIEAAARGPARERRLGRRPGRPGRSGGRRRPDLADPRRPGGRRLVPDAVLPGVRGADRRRPRRSRSPARRIAAADASGRRRPRRCSGRSRLGRGDGLGRRIATARR